MHITTANTRFKIVKYFRNRPILTVGFDYSREAAMEAVNNMRLSEDEYRAEPMTRADWKEVEEQKQAYEAWQREQGYTAGAYQPSPVKALI